MKVLITGGMGLLGSALLETSVHARTIGTYFSSVPTFPSPYSWVHLDLRDLYHIQYAIQSTYPDLVIHTAAVGDVNFYGKNIQKGAEQVNVYGSMELFRACSERDIPFVYISSNAVYGGEDPPYSETSQHNPKHAYGISKNRVEKIFSIEENPKWMIIRPMLLYGWNRVTTRKNWVIKILEKLKENKEVPLVTDVYYQPTYVSNLAEIIWQLIEGGDWGSSYNISSKTPMSLYEFGLEIALIFGLDYRKIKQAKASDFGGPERPLNTTYDTTKIRNLGIEVLDVVEGLTLMEEERPVW